MYREVKSAVDFLANILRTANVTAKDIETFRRTLQTLLCNHYKNHWFPEKPFKGSGYRCLRINHNMDPLIAEAGAASDLKKDKLYTIFPNELTMWIDPQDVSYRIGEDGSVGLLFTSPSPAVKHMPTSEAVNNTTVNNTGSQIQHVQNDWFQSCKEQFNLNFISHDNINFEHLAQYVSS